jgi:ATP-dependent Clp protease protease subunit
MLSKKTINDYIYDLQRNPDSIKNFDNILETNGFLNREIFVGDIDSDLGVAVNVLIRFYNQQDEEESIPVQDRKPIKIFIDSGGGDLDATFTIIDSIKMSKTPVWTINFGCAYSGGFFIFINGHKRFTTPLSTFLYHEGSTGNVGDAGKFRNFAEFYERQLALLKDIVLKQTNISEELYKEHQKDDWWLDANEALDLGIADEILERFI